MRLRKFTFVFSFVSLFCAAISAQSVNPGSETLEEKINRLEKSQENLQNELDQKENDDNQREAWSRRKAFTVGYSHPSLSFEGEKLSSNYGAFFSLQNTYLLHKKPLLGMIRFGLDATWCDINYYNHGNGSGVNIDGDFEDDGELYDADLGIHQVEIGMGIGPSVNIAPFCSKKNKLKYLRASVYCHVKPSLSMIMMSGDDDSSLYGGVPIFVNYGIKFSYRMLGIGIEGRTGSTNYNCWASDNEESDGGKMKFKTNSFRAYISLNF